MLAKPMVCKIRTRGIGTYRRKEKIPGPPTENSERGTKDRDPSPVVILQDAAKVVLVQNYIVSGEGNTHRSLKLINTAQAEKARSPIAKRVWSLVVWAVP